MVGAIILGIIAGYVGRLLMPGRDKMGFIATILLGLAGAVVGFLIFTELLGVGDNQMFDLGGLIGAVLGVLLLLLLYRAVLKNKEHPLAR
jgi:uncharacterized membrane protein YeaQ/YmgE (transglycosylase-associated protein family)